MTIGLATAVRCGCVTRSPRRSLVRSRQPQLGSATNQTPKQATPPRALGCRDDIEDAVV
jgi:hypothetical protein